jgi:hypothetical protein
VALLDTNVLYPARRRDLLMRLAIAGLTTPSMCVGRGLGRSRRDEDRRDQ